MKPRERVRKALRIAAGLPDRVPIQFDLCRQLLEHFGKKLGIPVSITENLYEDVTWRISGNEIRLAMGSDVVVTGASVRPDFQAEVGPDGTWLNEYGMRMRQGPVYVEVVEYPLAHVQTVRDIEDYRFPDLGEPARYADARRLVKTYRDDYFVIGDIEVTILTLVQQLVGMEKMLIDMALEAEYLPELIRRVTDFHTEHGLRMIECGVDALWVGDDFGAQNGLLFSPDMFRRYWKPAYERMNGAFRKAAPEITLILHCDGAVAPLLNDFKELGFDVFNPVQPGVRGHRPEDIQQGWGDQLAFWGGIDQQHLIPFGSDEELEAEIRHYIEVLGRGGGYMIAPAHILQPDVAPERVERFIELCRKYGAYA